MKIVTDCAADLSEDEAEGLDIEVAPLYIQFPDGEVNSSELSPDDFYTRLKNMVPQIPTTSQPSAGIFTGIYKKLVDIGEEIISIHISSGLSGTIESARLGAAHMPDKAIHIVDSLTLSGGERFQVLAAAISAKAGKDIEFILDRLSKIRNATEVIYTLDTLEYLQRGGRIGRVQALASSILHIKPIIHVEKSDGKYSTLGKERTIAKAIEGMVDYIVKIYGTETPLWVSVMHGQFSEYADKLAELVKSKVNVGKIEILRISPILGVHTGPGIVGLAVVPIHLMEGLD
ncbi:MAG: DegV family protein [Anaerolineales bacterium]|nr:DegV family protein [Anaerolineae bacterium]PWB53093.1 MAG: DegV family protein [Anaerolineales bacterium]